jgi:HD superfamily phosphohydrolase
MDWVVQHAFRHTFIKIENGVIRAQLASEAVSRHYQIVQPDGSPLDPSRELVPSIGGGAFGEVVRAVDSVGIHVAIKLITDLQIGADDTGPGTPTLFEREIRLSNAQPFKNVLPVVDYGTARDRHGKEYGFYVSRFVEGKTLRRFVDGIVRNKTAHLEDELARRQVHDQILLIILDILSGLTELERAHIVHMDVKPTNILVHSVSDDDRLADDEVADRSARGYLIDLGAAKSVEASPAGSTLLRYTEGWFPEHLLSKLQLESDDRYTTYERLLTCWRHIDPINTARVLETIFLDRFRRGNPLVTSRPKLQRQEEERETFWKAVFGPDFAVIEGVIDEMLACPRLGIKSAIDAKRAFEAISTYSATGPTSALTLTDRHAGLRVHTGRSLVRVSLPFDQIIRHPAFQRLRLIQQLSFVSEVYPDATHNRYSHSLWAFDLAKQFVWGLQRKAIFHRVFQRRDVDHFLAAALLSNISAYPFVHAFEELRREGLVSGDAAVAAIPRLEVVAADTLNEVRDGTSIRELLRSHDMNPDAVLYAIAEDEKSGDWSAAVNVTRDLIRGPVNVNRVAYLLQDSQRTGAKFGRAIDDGSLAEALTIRFDPETSLGTTGLGIDEEGVSTAEAVLTAVYWMYRNVYWVHNNRAFGAAIKFVVRWLLKEGRLTFPRFRRETLWSSDWQSLQFLREEYSALTTGGITGVNPLDALLTLRRIGYRRVYSLRLMSDDDWRLREKLMGAITFARQDALTAGIAELVRTWTEPQHGEILVDVPAEGKLRESGVPGDNAAAAPITTQYPLFVCIQTLITKNIDRWVDLSTYSPLVAMLGRTEEQNGMRFRVFFAESLLQRIPQLEWRKLEVALPKQLLSVTTHW